MNSPSLSPRVSVYVYVLISCILAAGTLFFLPIEPGYKIILANDSPLPSPTVITAFFFAGCFLLLFFFQTKISRSLDKKKAVLFLVIVIALYFLCMPFFSGDVFLYSFKGKIQSEISHNPYLPVPSAQYIDSTYRILSVWVFTPVAYGPLTNAVFRIFYIDSLSPFINMYILKSVFLLFFIVLLVLAYRKVSPANFIYFAFSPLILVETVLAAHLEIMPLLFFFLALLFYKEEKFPAAFLFAGIAAAFKLNYGLIVLPFLLERLLKKKLPVPSLILFPLPIGLSLLLYPDVRAYWDALVYESTKKGASALAVFDSFPLLRIIFYILIGAAALYTFYRFYKNTIDIWDFSYLLFLLLLFLDRNFQPWHLFPLYGIRLMQDRQDRNHFDIPGFLSMTGLYCIYFFYYAWVPQQNFITSSIMLTGLSVVFIRPFLSNLFRS